MLRTICVPCHLIGFPLSFRVRWWVARWDIPFANLYLLDEGMKHAFLEEVVGRQEKGSVLCPDIVTIPRLSQS